MREALKSPSKFTRFAALRGLGSGRVIRDGGDQSAGLIERFSVIARGEALGHEMWIDPDFLKETASAINARGKQGIKSRFTHPSASGDGLGKLLGHAKGASVVDDKVLADLHLSATAHSTPDGDLASYLMDLAENEPDSFGMSIVFERDFEAEEAGDRTEDPENTESLPPVRLAELRAVDAVDEPAANPDGMFHRDVVLVQNADDLLDYAFGLAREKPYLEELGLDADRIADYLQRWLVQRGMRVLDKDAADRFETLIRADWERKNADT